LFHEQFPEVFRERGGVLVGLAPLVDDGALVLEHLDDVAGGNLLGKEKAAVGPGRPELVVVEQGRQRVAIVDELYGFVVTIA
jgi:hypothetical protein